MTNSFFKNEPILTCNVCDHSTPVPGSYLRGAIKGGWKILGKYRKTNVFLIECPDCGESRPIFCSAPALYSVQHEGLIVISELKTIDRKAATSVA